MVKISKKLVQYYVISIVLLTIFISCTVPTNPSRAVFSEEALSAPLPPSLLEGVSPEEAALEFIKEWVATTPRESCGMWNETTQISSKTPIYNDGLTEPSYIEFGLSSEGKEAGYILITLDNSDIPIPEFDTDGTPPSKIFIDALGKRDFHINRYGIFGMRAVNPENDEILQESGVDGLDQIAKQWRKAVQSEGVIPYYSKKLFNYAKLAEDAKPTSRAGQSAVVDYVRLQHKYPDGNYTVSWSQRYWYGYEIPQPNGVVLPKLDENKLYPIGCGPTAFGVVYAYWQAFKGKTNLFPGVNLLSNYAYWNAWNDTVNLTVGNAILITAIYCGTTWSDAGGGTSVATMSNGIMYAKNQGYFSSSATWTSWGIDQWLLYGKVRNAIANDRPAIISVYIDGSGTPGIGVSPNHYVVVEEAKKTQYRVQIIFWLPWANGSTTYKINTCWGRKGSDGHFYMNSIDLDSYDNESIKTGSMWDVYDIIVQ